MNCGWLGCLVLFGVFWWVCAGVEPVFGGPVIEIKGVVWGVCVGGLASAKLLDLVWLGYLILMFQYRKMRAHSIILLSKVEKRRPVPAWKRFQLARNQGFRCASCWQLLPETFHVDHIRPLQFYGTDDERNWQILCPSCHDTKTIIFDPLLNKNKQIKH
jgi:hypothetical protein